MGVTMKRPDYGDGLKIGKWIFSGVRDLLHTTGIQSPAYIFRLPHLSAAVLT
jgi:hypothetical protein